MPKTITRTDIGEAIFNEIGLSRTDCGQLVECILKHLSDSLVKGEQVKISSFGTFSPRSKNARIGRNPKTGQEVMIEPRRVVTFRPSQMVRQRVSSGTKG